MLLANNPAGMEVRPVQPRKVLLNANVVTAVLLANNPAGMEVRLVQSRKVSWNALEI